MIFLFARYPVLKLKYSNANGLSEPQFTTTCTMLVLHSIFRNACWFVLGFFPNKTFLFLGNGALFNKAYRIVPSCKNTPPQASQITRRCSHTAPCSQHMLLGLALHARHKSCFFPHTSPYTFLILSPFKLLLLWQHKVNSPQCAQRENPFCPALVHT